MKPDFEIGIVGAGFAGLTAALRLKKAQKDSFVIFEKATEVGGNWRDNVYPGCACDVASPLYSFYDVPNPEWNNLFCPQPEILNYLKKTTSNFGLYEHIQFNTDILEVRFLKNEGVWKVVDTIGNITTVSILLLATGPLNRPVIPAIEGIETFTGKYFHTSKWDNEFDLTGKKVAVVGTGASAVQVIPNIADKVKQLTIFQRSPAWVADRNDKRISSFIKKLYRLFPGLQKATREIIYWMSEIVGFGFIGNQTINTIMKWVTLRKLKKEVKDVNLRKRLTPHYKIGCKRILKSDDFYPTFNRPNVSLVTGSIKEFTANGVVTSDGDELELDAVIFATGFEAADMKVYTKILGTEGENLIDAWKRNGAEAYLGTTVSGYPNMAFLLGPNTGLGHTSILHMMESQVNYIMQYISYIESLNGMGYIDIKLEVQQEYNRQIQEKLKKTVWNSGCKSWYLNSNGKNTTIYPGLTTTFRNQTRKFNPEIYNTATVLRTVTETNLITV